MLIMISGITGTAGTLTRTERPNIKTLTKQLVLDMILEECFQKSVEEVTTEECGDIAEQFDPLIDENTAMWFDSATEVTYTFILI